MPDSSRNVPGTGQPIDGEDIGQWLDDISRRVERVERQYSGPHSPLSVVACQDVASFPTARANMWALDVVWDGNDYDDSVWYESTFNGSDWVWTNRGSTGPPPPT